MAHPAEALAVFEAMLDEEAPRASVIRRRKDSRVTAASRNFPLTNLSHMAEYRNRTYQAP
jgi:hypothetical protein